MKYYSIGEFSTLIGKTPQTLRDWHKKGSFVPQHITDGGTRYYSQEQLNHFLGIKGIETKTKNLIQIVTVFSCRLQGKRANKAKKMIKELLESDTGEEN
ncbi:MAG: MerR family transcriptional regulator [Clostridium sp.]|uniref:MerR family transcriptional regulator n=1 Tax=Clostridium sp. TaxID=1506 RepID=UPI0025BFD8F4|nr:MerR family transcriptional regulator [Clostridium sp.]MCE5222419.1 MerR family transcriptional regulator [Clostridium sp.]